MSTLYVIDSVCSLPTLSILLDIKSVIAFENSRSTFTNNRFVIAESIMWKFIHDSFHIRQTCISMMIYEVENNDLHFFISGMLVNSVDSAVRGINRSFSSKSASLVGITIVQMIWLSKKRKCCRFNGTTFRLQWDRILCCLSKDFASKKRRESPASNGIGL